MVYNVITTKQNTKEILFIKIIPQISMFGESENKKYLGDLERLQKVIDFIPDRKIIRKLRQIRGNGRNEWKIEVGNKKHLCALVS